VPRSIINTIKVQAMYISITDEYT